MRAFRVSIAGLMGFVVLCGIALDALVHPTRFRTCGMTTLAFGILALALVGASLGRARAFWLGFAIFSGVYLIVGYSSWFRTADLLLTSAVMEELYPRLHPEEAKAAPVAQMQGYYASPPEDAPSTSVNAVPEVFPSPTPPLTAPADPPLIVATLSGSAGSQFYRRAPAFVQSQDYIHFNQIGHAFASMIAGLIGGFAALLFDARRRGDTVRESR